MAPPWTHSSVPDTTPRIVGSKTAMGKSVAQVSCVGSPIRPVLFLLLSDV